MSKNYKGYLYSDKTGNMVCREGSVCVPNEKSYYAYFVTGKKENDAITCSVYPIEMYNGMVWLEEKNDALAKSILINYHEEQIRMLESKIASHAQKIDNLRPISLFEGEQNNEHNCF